MPGDAGAELHALSAPVPFTDAPMVPVGTGRYRIADRSRRHWPEDPRFEVFTSESAWEPLRAVSVDRLSGTCELLEAPQGERVRATGLFLPLSRIGIAEGWRLDGVVDAPDTFSGGSPVFTGAHARLIGIRIDPGYLDQLDRPLLAVLFMGAGRYEAVGELTGNAAARTIAGDDLALAIDPGAITCTAD